LSRHLLIVGAQRCGTTFLSCLLDSHPQITLARPARPEPKVFLSDDALRLGADGYVSTYFSHAAGEDLLAEKSTSYIEVPEAADRARQVLGAQTQIVALLRDPVARAISNWRFSTDNALETRPLEQALRDNLAGSAPDWSPGSTSVSPFSYLERGRYAEHLAAWDDAFPDHTHVVFLQELLDDDDALGRLYGSLGVDEDFRPTERDPLNMSSEPVGSLPEDLLAALADYFEPANLALSRRLDRRLPWWPDPCKEA
jgi:Sulfotransferase domain